MASSELIKTAEQVLRPVRGAQSKVVIHALMNLEYPADPILEPDYVGMTYGEVAVMRQVKVAALGSRDALEMLLDRTEGKAIQTNVNATVGMSYMDFLKKVAAAEGETIDDATIVDRGGEEIS